MNQPDVASMVAQVHDMHHALRSAERMQPTREQRLDDLKQRLRSLAAVTLFALVSGSLMVYGAFQMTTRLLS